MMLADSRKFVGASFGLSISPPPADDPHWPRYYGEPESVVNEFVFTEGSNLLFEGGRLVLGHKWNDAEGAWNHAGILDAFAGRCREFQSYRPAAPDPVTGKTTPVIRNFLAWPDEPPAADVAAAARLLDDGVLSIEQVLPEGIPAPLLASIVSEKGSPLHRYARIRALTAMRRRLAEETDYRICVGGACGRGARRLPGIVEEALLTLDAGKPLYVSDAFGGASKALAECLLQRRVKIGEQETFFTPPDTADLMAAQAGDHPWTAEIEGPSTREGWNAFDWFQSHPLEEIAGRAGLTLDQYCQILAAKDVESAMGWILLGIRNLRTAAV
jgi:hypothetical protein